MYKYLIITEEQQVKGLLDEPTPNIMHYVNNGILTLIRIEDMKEYYLKEWHDIRGYKA